MGQGFQVMVRYDLSQEELTMSALSRVKTAFTSSNGDESHPYECKSCGARFRLQQQVCPECGGYTLDRIEWSSETTL